MVETLKFVVFFGVKLRHAHNICHRDLKLENFLYEIRSQLSQHFGSFFPCYMKKLARLLLNMNDVNGGF